jgi:uncharacterized membrane protein
MNSCNEALRNRTKAMRRFGRMLVAVAFGMLAISCAQKNAPSDQLPPAGADQTPGRTDAQAPPSAAVDSVPEAPESMIAVWEAAKARGVRFRGIGQEPGWIVDILGDPGSERLELTADYGEITLSFDSVTREEKSDPALTFYRGKSLEHSIEVQIAPEKCADTMSGQPYDHTVVVHFDGRELRGCGKKLE